MSDNRPIGIFDSGVGGLTVYRALREQLPQENFIYLGDTARLPYGTKSPETVTQYALQVGRRLVAENIKLLVVACNTVSAQALPALQQTLPQLPCLGVIEPGAATAAQTSGRVAVLATEGTIRSGAYQAAIRRHRPEAEVQGLACNLLVGMVEEGWCEGAEAEVVISRYLRQLDPAKFDTLVLGCTHFPLLAGTIRRLLPSAVSLIDSAMTTAVSVAQYLQAHDLKRAAQPQGDNRFLVTDAPERFQRLATRFLPDMPLIAAELIDLLPAQAKALEKAA